MLRFETRVDHYRSSDAPSGRAARATTAGVTWARRDGARRGKVRQQWTSRSCAVVGAGAVDASTRIHGGHRLPVSVRRPRSSRRRSGVVAVSTTAPAGESRRCPRGGCSGDVAVDASAWIRGCYCPFVRHAFGYARTVPLEPMVTPGGRHGSGTERACSGGVVPSRTVPSVGPRAGRVSKCEPTTAPVRFGTCPRTRSVSRVPAAIEFAQSERRATRGGSARRQREGNVESPRSSVPRSLARETPSDRAPASRRSPAPSRICRPSGPPASRRSSPAPPVRKPGVGTTASAHPRLVQRFPGSPGAAPATREPEHLQSRPRAAGRDPRNRRRGPGTRAEPAARDAPINSMML